MSLGRSGVMVPQRWRTREKREMRRKITERVALEHVRINELELFSSPTPVPAPAIHITHPKTPSRTNTLGLGSCFCSSVPKREPPAYTNPDTWLPSSPSHLCLQELSWTQGFFPPKDRNDTHYWEAFEQPVSGL